MCCFCWVMGKDAREFSLPALLCTVYVCGCLWHAGRCQRTESPLWQPPRWNSTESQGKERKARKKARKCPHECDIVLLDSFAHHDNHAEWRRRAGGPLAFRASTIRRGTAVLTPVTSLLSAGQMLEYQWTDSVPLVVVLKTVQFT